jgi:tetratricopeptide (TPR) repeat protein
MLRKTGHKDLFMIAAVVAMAFFIVSCAPKSRVAVGEMDTASHHTSVGAKYLEQGKYAEAAKQFDLALSLDPTYAGAHAGMAVTRAYEGDMRAALDAVKLAKKYAKTKDDTIAANCAAIRVHTLNPGDKKWLAHAFEAYEEALRVDANAPAPYFFMGQAYKAALDFPKAGQMFTRVLELKGDYVGQADNEWRLVQKIQRAMPGTEAGKKIAILDKITRADAAALFMEELKLDKLYQKRSPKAFDTGFKDPEAAKAASAAGGGPTASDIAEHPLKADIEGVLGVGVRGLENYPDGSFHPQDFVDRAAYAMMIEDILVKITGDETLATKFIGAASPFPDLRSDLPYFNAVMVLTSRGIMEVVDMASGEFAPLKPVTGPDALLIIRKMREELKF